jgi:hypothetical protein
MPLEKMSSRVSEVTHFFTLHEATPGPNTKTHPANRGWGTLRDFLICTPLFNL